MIHVPFHFSPPFPPRPPRYPFHQRPRKLTSTFDAPDVEVSGRHARILQWTWGLERWWGRHRTKWGRAACRATWRRARERERRRWRWVSFVVRVGELGSWREREEWRGCGSCGRERSAVVVIISLMDSCNLYNVICCASCKWACYRSCDNCCSVDIRSWKDCTMRYWKLQAILSWFFIWAGLIS